MPDDVKKLKYTGLITKEQALEILDFPLREGETVAGRVQLVTDLLLQIEEECEGSDND